MPRKGKRVTIMRGCYKDSGGIEVRVTVGGTTYYGPRLPLDSTRAELKKAVADLRALGHTETPPALHGTLRKHAQLYIKSIKHLASWDDREDHLNAWCEDYGDVQRHRITEQDVVAMREKWRLQGLSPRTIQHRCDTLRNLFHRLDGRKAKTPCDGIPALKMPKTIIRRVSDDLILTVDRNLQARERDVTKQFQGAKTRARFRVFVSTGKRPCEIMRAERGDVNIAARVWVPRDAKGGFCPGVYLNDDQLEAWKLFIAADAWGSYNHGNFGRVIRKAGWPADIRPYQARHTMWITARERGVPLDVVADGAGHKDGRLTKRFYTGILNGPLQAMSETMDGRFQGWPVVPKTGSRKNSSARRRKSQG